MSRSLFLAATRLFSFLVTAAVCALIGLVAWAYWELYGEVKLSNRFAAEGQPVTVHIDRAMVENRHWWDHFYNVVYLTFTHQQRPYTVRFVQDTLFVGDGADVTLLYHPALDAFKQPGHRIRLGIQERKSRLIHWTSVNLWNEEQKWLILCLGFSAFFFLLFCGLLGTITRLTFIRTAGKFIFILLLASGAMLLTYDTWKYFQYHRHITTHGQPEKVTILGTAERSKYKGGKRSWSKVYEATVLFKNETWVIPLEKEDYKKLKPGDPLHALYDNKWNDLMPANYSPDYFRIVLLLLIWLIVYLVIRWVIRGDKKKGR